MTTEERLSSVRTIPATPAEIFAVVSDPRGHVAIDGSGMLMAAPDAKPLTAVGDEFPIDMDRESLGDVPLGKYQVINVVTKFEKDKLIEWTITAPNFPRIGHVYGYQLAPVDGGTEVTSYYDWSDISEEFKATGRWPIVPGTALRITLGILERVVASGGI